ncbi:hypothetical protein [Caenimonas sp. SL110]|uniref:hypothetical protein n=1 Tax=Caenimonas sp. SL110 TaxID=1450524 RepID=UPI000654ABBB|nr:hypothetical protein [Caenimonas sp. SL110]
MNTHLIETENLPIWTVSAMIVALLALVVAFASIYRTHIVIVGTQSQVLTLNKKIEELRSRSTAAVAAPAPAQAQVDPAKK